MEEAVEESIQGGGGSRFLGHLKTFTAIDRNIRLYLISYASMTFGLTGILAVLANLYLLRLGYGVDVLGITGGLMLGSMALACLPAGVLGRWLTVRTILVASACLLIVGFALLVIAESLHPVVQLPAILASGVLLGTAMAMNVVWSYPLLMTCADEKRAAVFSLRRMAEIVGAVTGGYAAGFLPGLLSRLLALDPAGPAPYRAAISVAVLANIVVLVLVARIEPLRLGTNQSGAPQPEHIRQAAGAARPLFLIAAVSVISLLSAAAGGTTRSFLNAWLDSDFGVTAAIIGSIFATSQLISLPATLLAPALISRFGRFQVILMVFFVQAATILLMAIAPRWELVAASFLVGAVFASTGGPAFDLFHQSIVAPEHRPFMAGAHTMSFGIGYSGALFAGGIIAAMMGFPPLYLAMFAVKVLCAALFIAFFWAHRGTGAAGEGVAQEPDRTPAQEHAEVAGRVGGSVPG
jgi:MFS family permease